MDFKEKSPPDAEKSQKEVHIVEYLESKGYKYPTCRSSELKICAECHGITGFRSFRSHLKKFHKEFSQSVMDRLVEESPRTTVSKKTSMSSDDMISLVPWSVRYPELFRKLNNDNTADKTSMTKKRTDLWTSHSEYIELSDFLVKMTKNSGELVPQGEHRIASEYIENSRSTRTIYVIKRRIRNFRSTILENEKFDTETKVKLVFLLSASVGSTFLEKIRQTAHVELDEENRITVYKSETLNLQGDHSISAKLRALQADKKRRENQIPVKNETEKPKSSEIQTDGKVEELTEVVDLTMDSYDPEQSEKAQSEKLRISDSKNSDAKAEASESKKEKSSESQPSNLKKLFLKAKSSKILISKSSNTREEMPDSEKKVSSEYSDKKSMLPEPKSSIRRVPSVKLELLLPKTSIRVAPPTTKHEKDGKSIVSKAPKSEKKDSPSISQFFPKVSNAPTAEKPKSSNTVAPPASESKNESIYEIEEPPKRQVSSTKSEDKRSESVRIHVSGCPVTPKSTESDSESDETYVCEEEKYCREEYEEDTGEEEESDESSNNSEDEAISEMEERQLSDSESENSENSELTENSGCDEEDVEDCIVDDEEEEEEEESEIHQTPPFRPQTANGNESISPNSHKRFLKLFLIFVSSLDLPMLNDLEERIMDRILEIKQFEMRSQEKMTMNEIRAGLMASLLIVTKSATSSSTSSSTESTISLSVYLELFEEFVVTLKWKSLKKFVQRMRSSIEELGEQDKKIPSRKVAFALQTIIEIAAP